MLSIGLVALVALSLASAQPLNASSGTVGKPGFFILAGDSTTAPQSPGGGGWGAGFLSVLNPPASGTNLGQNGATTVSFKQNGNWAKVMEGVRGKSKERAVYVTIQFGHNDQKPDRGISLDQYKANLVKMVTEVRDGGGTPILVTPLTRRSFSGPKVTDNLKEQRAGTIAAAESSKTVYLDLNAESQRYVNAIGPGDTKKYNSKEGDTSHLNAEGSKVFGRMVADLMVAKIPATEEWIKQDEKMSAKIKAGKPAR